MAWRRDSSATRSTAATLGPIQRWQPLPPRTRHSLRFAPPRPRKPTSFCRWISPDSTVRTADQTAAVHFWFHQTQFVWNDIARTVASAHDKGLWRTARVFALVNMALMDGLIALFETKYFYNYWRPYTAIREIDDGRSDTEMDPHWLPLLNTPGYPEHGSAQATTAAAAAFMLEKVYGKNVAFTITTATAQPPGSTRTFANFAAAVSEGADSRIWAGIHFRSATGKAARQQGKAVGAYLFRHFLRKSS